MIVRLALVFLLVALAVPARAAQCGGGQCIGDLNADHNVNGADLGILLSSWGTCAQ